MYTLTITYTEWPENIGGAFNLADFLLTAKLSKVNPDNISHNTIYGINLE